MPKVSDDSSGDARRHQGAQAKESEAYRQKRERNNLAVKKSREKSRQKSTETSKRVAVLRAENDELEQKVDGLTKELGIMKELLLAHARGNKPKLEPATTPTTVPPPSMDDAPAASPEMKMDEGMNAPDVQDHEYFGPTSGEASGLIADGDVFTDMFAISEDVYLEEYVE